MSARLSAEVSVITTVAVILTIVGIVVVVVNEFNFIEIRVFMRASEVPVFL